MAKQIAPLLIPFFRIRYLSNHHTRTSNGKNTSCSSCVCLNRYSKFFVQMTILTRITLFPWFEPVCSHGTTFWPATLVQQFICYQFEPLVLGKWRCIRQIKICFAEHRGALWHPKWILKAQWFANTTKVTERRFLRQERPAKRPQIPAKW